MKVSQIIIILISVAIITSCGLLKTTDFSLIKIGMTTEEVQQKLGKPVRVVAAKRYSDGVIEVYEYARIKAQPDTLQNWLYFYNNELQEWGPKELYVPNSYDNLYNKYKNRR